MFIAFEGIDGSGKTTVSNLAVEELQRRGIKVKHLRAEGRFASTVTEAIRGLARDSRHLELVPEAEFLLYVARDVQLIEEALRPALETHDVVIGDRFLYTAEALARFGRGLPRTFVAPVLHTVAKGLSPDLVVLVDVHPSLARARRKAAKILKPDQKEPSRKGLSGVGLQHRLRDGYLELASEHPERWLVVENEDSLERTVARVVTLIENAVRRGVTTALTHDRGSQPTRRKAQAKPLDSVEAAMHSFLAWVDARKEREPQVAAYMLSGLHGEPIDGLRRELAERVPEVVLHAALGLDDALSFSLREAFAEKYPKVVARSLRGRSLSSPARAFALREKLAAEAPSEVASSLSRLDDEASWALREKLYDRAEHAVMGSLVGLDHERAWSMRLRWLEAHQKGIKDDFEAAKSLARSVGGLDDEKAWELRKRSMSAAPVPTIASLYGLSSERSWIEREKYLSRATKVVMATLRKNDHARSWPLREQVAAACKEAIDSLRGLDDERAWALREAYADVWPSTVLKSLGILSDRERGSALLHKLLSAHPQNLSLLKHATAVALGNHRSDLPEED